MAISKIALQYSLVRLCSLKKAQADLRALKQLELVKTVAVERTTLKVRTKPLFCRRTGTALGYYTIIISLRTGRIRVVSDDPVEYDSYTYHHAFVTGARGGRHCWGNVSRVISVLAREKDFPALVSVLIEFLQVTASQEYGKYLLDIRKRRA